MRRPCQVAGGNRAELIAAQVEHLQALPIHRGEEPGSLRGQAGLTEVELAEATNARRAEQFAQPGVLEVTPGQVELAHRAQQGGARQGPKAACPQRVAVEAKRLEPGPGLPLRKRLQHLVICETPAQVELAQPRQARAFRQAGPFGRGEAGHPEGANAGKIRAPGQQRQGVVALGAQVQIPDRPGGEQQPFQPAKHLGRIDVRLLRQAGLAQRAEGPRPAGQPPFPRRLVPAVQLLQPRVEHPRLRLEVVELAPPHVQAQGLTPFRLAVVLEPVGEDQPRRVVVGRLDNRSQQALARRVHGQPSCQRRCFWSQSNSVGATTRVRRSACQATSPGTGGPSSSGTRTPRSVARLGLSPPTW